MSPYHSSDWQGFLAALRADPEGAAVPLIAADWLEERAGKPGHARFIRACVEYAGLGFIPKGPNLYRRYQLDTIVADLFHAHRHEWTAGAVRGGRIRLGEWKNGFLWSWECRPILAGSDRETDMNEFKKLDALLRRQPITRLTVTLPQHTFAPPSHHVEQVRKRYPGLAVEEHATRMAG